ncbi:hypothetical protein ACLK2H_01130 [Escherichia coli]
MGGVTATRKRSQYRKAQPLADLADLDVLSKEDLLNRRYQRLMI